MNILKRGKLAVLSLAFMLVVAGYINYRYNPQREKNLGQTVYVNGKDSYTYPDVSIYGDQTDTQNNKADQNTTNTDNKENNNQIASNEEDSIAVFKYDRDNMFSQLSENYKEIISNDNTPKEKINEYQVKLNDLIFKKTLINMVENIIKAKGIEDIVIIPTNNDNLNVIVKSNEEIKPEQIAQIQQVIVDQFGVSADKISITVQKGETKK